MTATDDEVPDQRSQEPRVDPRLLRPDPGESLEQFKERLLAEVLELRDRAHFEVIAPTGPAASVLVHVPHASTSIPADVRAGFSIDDEALATELLRLTDHRTDVLAEGVAAVGATRFVNRRSRLVVDPERFTDDSEPMLQVGMGPVYTHGHDRSPIRELTDGDRRRLLETYFEPYAAAFAAEVGRLLEDFGACTVVDVHSYPREQLPYELDDGPRPQLCVGVDERHTPKVLVDVVLACAADHGLTSAVNTPFAGAYVPMDRYGLDDRVSAVMLEIRRDTYLDEETAQPHDGEADVAAFVTDVVATITSVAGR